MTFVRSPSVGEECNHIDGIKTNNFVYNLEWATSRENKKHAYKCGLWHHKGEGHTQVLVNNEYVYCIKELLYSSDLTQKEIRFLFGISQAAISNIESGRTWEHIIYP